MWIGSKGRGGRPPVAAFSLPLPLSLATAGPRRRSAASASGAAYEPARSTNSQIGAPAVMNSDSDASFQIATNTSSAAPGRSATAAASAISNQPTIDVEVGGNATAA